MYRVLKISTLCACLSLAIPAHAQQTTAGTPALDEILSSIHQRFATFVGTVPNLFAEEHVLSSITGSMDNSRSKTTDSIFRLKREVINGRPKLVESRETKGGAKAGSEQGVGGPSVLRGVFTTGLMDFSVDLKRCYDYQLKTDQKWKSLPVIILQLQSKTGLPESSTCPIKEPMTGAAVLDARTLQVLHVEETLSSHEILRGSRGEWKWSVDYMPVDLDGKVFWLPSQVTSNSSLPGARPIDWMFTAMYRNYHLLTVSSKILPENH